MGKKVKVLIVEDEYLIAKQIQKLLGEMGYDTCKPVATGEAALESVKLDRPDIVLMDLSLEGKKNGIETARAINSSGMTPIMFMTGYADRRLTEKMERLKPIACFVKPLNIAEIARAIDSVFPSRVPSRSNY